VPLVSLAASGRCTRTSATSAALGERGCHKELETTDDLSRSTDSPAASEFRPRAEGGKDVLSTGCFSQPSTRAQQLPWGVPPASAAPQKESQARSSAQRQRLVTPSSPPPTSFVKQSEAREVRNSFIFLPVRSPNRLVEEAPIVPGNEGILLQERQSSSEDEVCARPSWLKDGSDSSESE